MWQGLRTICSFGNKSSLEVRADSLLAVELNTFYGRFECNGLSATLPISESGSSRQSSDDHVITVSEDEVRRELKRVNVRKAAGPDGITGHVLRSCADQLTGHRKCTDSVDLNVVWKRLQSGLQSSAESCVLS